MSITPFPTQGQYPWYDQLEQWGTEVQTAAEAAKISADQVHADVATSVSAASQSAADARSAADDAAAAAGLVGVPAGAAVDAAVKPTGAAYASLLAGFAGFAEPENVTVPSPGKAFWGGDGPMFEYHPTGGGALWHLVPTATQTAPYTVGVGLDHDNTKGFVFSLKADNNFGIALNVETSAGPASIGGIVHVLGQGKGMEFRQGPNAAGHLLVLKGGSGSPTGRMLSIRNDADQESGYFDATGRLWLQSTGANPHGMNWNFGSGPYQRFYSHVSPTSALASRMGLDAVGRRFQIQQARVAAARGAESLFTMLEAIDGKHVSFFGRSASATDGEFTILIPDAASGPSAPPAAGGGVLYGFAGALRWMNPSGHTISLARQPAIPSPAGGSVVDVEARAAIAAILTALRPGQIGLIDS